MTSDSSQTVFVSRYLLNMGPGDVRLPGSLVPEFNDWSYSVQKAHLDRGRVQQMTKGQWERERQAERNPVPVKMTLKKPSSTPKTKRKRATPPPTPEAILDDVELQPKSSDL